MIQEGNLSFLGGGAAFRPVSGASGTNDKFGFDQYVERFMGPPSKLAAFRALWPKNKQHKAFAAGMPSYPWLFLVDFSWTNGPEIDAVLTWKGSLLKDPKEAWESDTTLTPLQLRNGSARTTAEYYMPVTTIRYIVVGDYPRELSFKGRMLQTNFAYEIFNQRGPGTIGIASGGGGTTTGTGVPISTTYTLVPRVVSRGLKAQQVGGCWQCTEENEGRLEAPELRPRIGMR